MTENLEGGINGFLYHCTPESRLWRHVLMRAATDSAYGSAKQKWELLGWVQNLDGQGDFDQVCHYAAAKADFLAEKFFDILCAPRAPAIILCEHLKDAILAKDGEDASQEQQDDPLRRPEGRSDIPSHGDL